MDRATSEPEIRATVDGFRAPLTLTGWAVKRMHQRFVADLRIEAWRGQDLVASTTPTGPRPDVTGDAVVPAAFGLVCGGGTTLDDILGGAVRLRAVDPTGRATDIPIWQPTRAAMQTQLLLDTVRRADAAQVLQMIDALSSNATLTGEAALALRQARRITATAIAMPRAAPRTGPKITLIGAGSTVFAKALIGDILLHPALAGSRICLHDIDPERLRVSVAVAGRIRATLDGRATVESTLDLGAALDGADYAITMIQVGGYRPCTVTDFEVPKRFGLRQTIGDTLGIGGIMRGLRTIPVLLRLAREMERRCPDVLHLNYANPMAMACWALARGTRIRTVGLCHSVQNTAAEIAHDVDVPIAAVDYLAAGINHMAFYLKLAAGGEDLYPRLHRVITEGRVPAWNRVRYDVLRRFGYFVTESSEHFAEYVPWYIKRDRPDLIEAFSIPLDEYPRRCELQTAEWHELAQALAGGDAPLEVRPSQEYGATIINAVETGQPAVIYGNVANDGLIANLPQGCCVEVPCLVDRNGVQPVRVGALPPQLAALMQTNIGVQALTVEAALTGRRQHVYHAAMLDPHTAAELDPQQISTLVEAMLDAHGGWVPRELHDHMK